MSATIVPPLAVAPMEGLTGFVFRQVFSRHFTGADDWFIPVRDAHGPAAVHGSPDA
ncbi:MAG: hypothetical protein ACLUNV_09035 [Sutterella wadsworthensis]